MPIERTESIEIRTSNDIVRVRQLVREWAVEAGFSLVDQTKMVTAASELAQQALLLPSEERRQRVAQLRRHLAKCHQA